MPKFSLAGRSHRVLSDLTTGFALKLYRAIAAKEHDFVFSPIGICTSLLASYFGARGETAKEISSLIGLEDSDMNALVTACSSLASSSASRAFELSSATSLWTDSTCNLSPEFVETAEKIHVEVNTVKFTDPGWGLPAVNEWVEKSTGNKIRDPISSKAASPPTAVLLVNAIYCTGLWREQFERGLSTEERFWINRHDTVNALMMTREGLYNYGDAGDLQILELPYAGNDVSMFILLPASRIGLSALERNLDNRFLDRLTRSLVRTTVKVIIPRFSQDFNYDLTSTLRSLGMKEALCPSSADFSGMDGRTNALWISSIMQQAKIEVGEAGTLAPAATAVNGVRGLPLKVKPIVFRANRPFLFYILHKRTRNILLMGRISNPA